MRASINYLKCTGIY